MDRYVLIKLRAQVRYQMPMGVVSIPSPLFHAQVTWPCQLNDLPTFGYDIMTLEMLVPPKCFLRRKKTDWFLLGSYIFWRSVWIFLWNVFSCFGPWMLSGIQRGFCLSILDVRSILCRLATVPTTVLTWHFSGSFREGFGQLMLRVTGRPWVTWRYVTRARCLATTMSV